MWNRSPTRLRVEHLETREVPAAPLWNLALGYNDHGVGKVRFMEAANVALTFETGDQLDFNVPPYPCQELRVAVGDVNGDGTADVITANGPNINSRDGPSIFSEAIVRVFDGTTLPGPFESITQTPGPRLIAAFLLPWKRGGAFLAAGDIDGDGYAEVVAGRDIRPLGNNPPPGLNEVAVYSGRDLTNLVPTTMPTPLVCFMGIDDPAWWGGDTVAVGDVSGDGTPDVVVGAGRFAAARVAVWDGTHIAVGGLRKVCGDFFADDPGYSDGANVAVADLDQDRYGDILTSNETESSSRIVVTEGHSLVIGNPTSNSFYIGLPSPLNPDGAGKRLAVKDFNGDKVPDLAVSHLDGKKIELYLGFIQFNSIQFLTQLDPFNGILVGTNHGGVWVG